MQRAGLAAALPVLSRNTELLGGDGMEVLDRTSTPSQWRDKWFRQGFGSFLGDIGLQNRMPDTMMQYINVQICHPLQSTIGGHTYSVDGTRYVPFDDPDLAGMGEKTKLVIELTMNYRLVVPFADWVIWNMVHGRDIVKELRLKTEGLIPDMPHSSGAMYEAAAVQDIYILPIRAQYAMKMHSDMKYDDLPNQNNCQAGGGSDD
jgi:hypothetical protein